MARRKSLTGAFDWMESNSGDDLGVGVPDVGQSGTESRFNVSQDEIKPRIDEGNGERAQNDPSEQGQGESSKG